MQCFANLPTVTLKKLKDVIASLELKNNGLVYYQRIHDVIALKPFIFICCYRWQRWKWIET